MIGTFFEDTISQIHILKKDTERKHTYAEKFRAQFMCDRLIQVSSSSPHHVKDYITNLPTLLSAYLEKVVTKPLLKKEEELLDYELPVGLSIEILTHLAKHHGPT